MIPDSHLRRWRYKPEDLAVFQPSFDCKCFICTSLASVFSLVSIFLPIKSVMSGLGHFVHMVNRTSLIMKNSLTVLQLEYDRPCERFSILMPFIILRRMSNEFRVEFQLEFDCDRFHWVCPPIQKHHIVNCESRCDVCCASTSSFHTSLPIQGPVGSTMRISVLAPGFVYK